MKHVSQNTNRNSERVAAPSNVCEAFETLTFTEICPEFSR